MKIKNIQKKWILFGMASFVCLIGILDTLSKGTSANSTADSLSISCNDSVYAGSVVNCDILLLSNSITTYGISAKYNVSSQLTYIDFVNADEWSIYSEDNYKDSTGFVLLSDGVVSDSVIGMVSYQIPSDAEVGTVYTIGVTDIVIGDGEDTEVTLDSVSAEVTVIGEEVELSSINTLAGIVLNGGSLNEVFESNVNSYTASAESDSVLIEVIKTDDKSSVTGDVGSIALVEGNNELKIYVTSESGVVNTYIINIYKAPVDNPEQPEEPEEPDNYSYSFSSELQVDNDKNYITNIKSNKTVSYLKNAITTVGCNVVVYNIDNEIKSDNVLLKTGDLLIIYKDDQIIEMYLLSVSGDSNGDGEVDLIDLVQIRKQIIGWINPETNEIYNKDGVYYQSLDLNKDSVVDLIDLVRMRKIIVGWYDDVE